MKKKDFSLPVEFTVASSETFDDERFLNVYIDVLHTGLNFNNSFFSKSVVDKNIDSIKNTPILGFITETANGEKDFAGHEYIRIEDEDDNEEYKYIGSAYGLIPESCNPRWINKVCDDGVEREFLRVDGLIWSKLQDAAEILTNACSKSHSMELDPETFEGYEDENGVFVVTDFSFYGCCILGESIEPAMINSIIKISDGKVSKDFCKMTKKDIKEIVFEIFDKYINDSKLQQGGGIMSNANFAQTHLGLFDDIRNIVEEQENINDIWGDSVPRYSLCDLQENEVICFDRKNNWQYIGFEYSINGDKPVINFECGKRKKVSYEDYVDGSSTSDSLFDFSKFISEFENTAKEKIKEFESKVEELANDNASELFNLTSSYSKVKVELENTKAEYESIKKEFDEMKPKYEAYVNAEEEAKEKEILEAKDTMFSKFEDSLGDNEEFVEIKNKKDEYSLEEIESKCSVLFVRNCILNKVSSMKTDFSKQDTYVKLGVNINENDEDNNIVKTKYGDIRVNR